MPPIVTFEDPGTHIGEAGLTVKLHGPLSEGFLVAGLAGELHIPNRGPDCGTSLTVNTTPADLTLPGAKGCKVNGDLPYEHMHIAPACTRLGILITY